MTVANPALDEPHVRTRERAGLAVWLSAGTLAVIVAMTIAAPWFSLPDPDAQDLDSILLPVGADGHLLGTDALGRDLLSRIVYGARVSLAVSLLAVVVAATLGGILGMVSGYLSGKVDRAVMMVMDVLMSFPPLILALLIAAFLGVSARNVVIALIFSSFPGYVRFARAETVRLRTLGFVQIAKLNGAPQRSVLLRHISPNVAGPMATYGLTMLGVAILVEASLSFLGLGVRPPQSSIGIIIAEGKLYLASAPHLVLAPGLVLCALIISLNVLSDRLIARRQKGMHGR